MIDNSPIHAESFWYICCARSARLSAQQLKIGSLVIPHICMEISVDAWELHKSRIGARIMVSTHCEGALTKTDPEGWSIDHRHSYRFAVLRCKTVRSYSLLKIFRIFPMHSCLTSEVSRITAPLELASLVVSGQLFAVSTVVGG